MKFYSPDMSDECKKAFLLGYRAGFQDASEGKNSKFKSVSTDPIEVLGLSARAYNRLHYSGFRYVSEVAALPVNNILQIRGMGKVTASEVAAALQALGIHGTDWDLFRC